ncbi:MAG: hypothetical protein HQ517_16595 [SAR324 cluster bacterium]|nr:hypothetical protein [SAR324 cluster bacterium]
MLKESLFAQAVVRNERSLKLVLDNLYRTATSILSNHPLYVYFEKYVGGYLIVMDSDGTVLASEDDEAFMLSQRIGYIHPLDRDMYYETALKKAQSLLHNNRISCYETLSEEAGAIKTKDGLIFSYSGFEFLELNDKQDSEDYRDIFETMNLYTLLSHDFFDTEKQVEVNPHRYSFEDNKDKDYNIIREEILFSLSNEELIDVATKISENDAQYNFGLLNEVFISKVLLETGFIDLEFVQEIIKISNNRFISDEYFK